MGKTGKNLKRRRLAQQEALAASAPLDVSDEDSPSAPDFLLGLISPQQLAVTVRTLQTLTKQTELLQPAHKAELKGLRGAVFDFQRVANEIAGVGSTLTSRISSALADSRHLDALILLAELQLRGQRPKLGALQRWVRDCDAASRADGSYGDEEVLKVLEAVLRCTNGAPGDGETTEEDGALRTREKGEGVVVRQKEWAWKKREEGDIWAEIKAGSFPAPADKTALAAPFVLLQETPGPDRLPPNLHSALLFSTHLSPPSPLSTSHSLPVTRLEVPHVPGAFLLTDILTQAECRAILGAAEAVGFRPDQPAGEKEGASVLAHNLYWLADPGFIKTFTDRFLHLVPQSIDGGEVTGINARFRVYRYVPGAIYRPHIDGAWPASGVDPVTGEYLYDSSPTDKPQWSRLTFLIYLNDTFPAGHTTFFLPSPTTSQTLNAFPVKPSAGSALVFPHGDSLGSLLHEGSPVGEGGAKYVIRTEVLYRVRGKEEKREVEAQKEGEVDEGVMV